jgi:hypothetical protein
MELAWSCCCFLLATCARALRRLLQLPALLCCEAMVWAVTFLAFPLRMLTAVERERKVTFFFCLLFLASFICYATSFHW